MEKTNWQELAAKYLTGQCSVEELKMLKERQEATPDEQDYVQSLAQQEQAILEERLLNSIHQGILQLESAEKATSPIPESVGPRLGLQWPRLLTRVAAILLLGLGLGYLVHTQFNSSISFQQMTNNTAHPIRHVLEDGSVVWLNSKTTLSYPRAFAAGQREVRLNGEAFFEVTKNPTRPFIIRSGHIVTRVLGTSFNVKAYQGDEAVEVNVITGRVAVQKLATTSKAAGSNAEDKLVGVVILKPNEKAIYDTKSEQLTKALTEKPIEKIAWKEGKLLFDNVSVREVVKTLERKYNIVIQTPNEAVGNCIIKVDATGHSLENTLKMVCQLVNAAYTLDKHEVIIQGQGCPVSPESQSTF